MKKINFSYETKLTGRVGFHVQKYPLEYSKENEKRNFQNTKSSNRL